MTPDQRRQINEQMAMLARNGHPESWGELYRLLRPIGVGMAARQIKDPHVLEDIVQASFLRLREVRHRFREGASAVSFYEAVLVNVMREDRARRKRDRAVPLLADLSEFAEEPPSGRCGATLSAPECGAHSSHFWEEFDKTVDRMHPGARETVTARLLENMTSAQAAEAINASPTAVRKRLERALDRLRAALGGFRSIAF